MRAEYRLMTAFGVEESVIGDITEQHRAGRSTIWLWRQTVVAVATRLARAIHDDPAVVGVVAITVAVDVALPYLWMHHLWHYALMLHVAWYPRAFNWLAGSSPHALWQIVVFLHPWEWTFGVGWCALLGMIAWCLVGVWPKRVTVVAAAFVLANLCQTLPVLERSFVEWARDPHNPVWASNVVCYGFLTLLAIPASIFVGSGVVLQPKSA